MFEWFLNKKRKKKGSELEQRFVYLLTDQYPKIAEIHANSKLLAVLSIPSPIPFIQLQHSINEPYFKRNRSNHKDCYTLEGIQIKEIKSGRFVDLKLEITWDLISQIKLDFPDKFWNRYDLDSIRVGSLTRTDIQLNNEDARKLKKVLKNIDIGGLEKLEADGCFEIEFGGKKFLTILDMEDGNYIAVNDQGQVFRLNHDSEYPTKLIYTSVEGFLKDFSGNKKDLEKHFEV